MVPERDTVGVDSAPAELAAASGGRAGLVRPPPVRTGRRKIPWVSPGQNTTRFVRSR